MTIWNKTVDVSSVFHNDDMSFIERRDAIVKKFRDAWPVSFTEDESLEINDILDELEETEDVEEFNSVWDEVYDWADYRKVWIKTR
jgi:hypothetical protein